MRISLDLFYKTLISISLTLILAYSLNDINLISKLVLNFFPVLLLLVSLLAAIKVLSERTTVIFIFLCLLFQYFLLRFIDVNFSVVLYTGIGFIFVLLTMFITQFKFLKID